MTQASILRQVSVTTSFVALESQRCSRVNILNSTGASMDIQMQGDTGSGKLISLPTATSVTIGVVSNASEIGIKAASGASGVQLVID